MRLVFDSKCQIASLGVSLQLVNVQLLPDSDLPSYESCLYRDA